MTMSKIARTMLFVDESRIWNLDEPADGKEINMKTNLKSHLLGDMWDDVHVESLLNIRDSSKNLVIS